MLDRFNVTIKTKRYMTTYKSLRLIPYMEKEYFKFKTLKESKEFVDGVIGDKADFLGKRGGEILNITIERIVLEEEINLEEC